MEFDADGAVCQLRRPAYEPPDRRRGSGRSRVGVGARLHRVSEPRVPGCKSVPRDRGRQARRVGEGSCRRRLPRLGIWTNNTFDYIAPSVAIARKHLTSRGLAEWIPEIEAMIVDHHKVTPSRANPQSLVESFRRADWIDVSRGLRRFGLPRTFIAAVATTWPNAGFHRRLVQLTIDCFWKHPLTPLPMVK